MIRLLARSLSVRDRTQTGKLQAMRSLPYSIG